MDAKQARKITEENSTGYYYWKWSDEDIENQVEGLQNQVLAVAKETLEEGIKARAGEGKNSIVIEPFFSIPGKFHPQLVEDKIASTLSTTLQEGGFYPLVEDEDTGDLVFWHRVDGRVVFRLRW